MAPIYILFGFGLGFLLGKVIHPDNVWKKILWSIGLPCLIFGYYFLIYGIDMLWNMYQVGLKTIPFFFGGIGLLVSLLIFLRQSKLTKDESNSTSIDKDCKNIETPDTNQTDSLYLNKYLTAIFSIWMVGVGLSAIGPFVKLFYVGYGEEITYGVTTFIISMMGVFSMYGMLSKKRWGLILCIMYGAGRFASYMIWNSMVGEIDVWISLVSFLFLVLLLFISEDDYSAYYVIWNNGEKSINETY